MEMLIYKNLQLFQYLCMVQVKHLHFRASVAVPGFPVGGVDLIGGVDSEATMFRKICMSKQKNWVP